MRCQQPVMAVPDFGTERGKTKGCKGQVELPLSQMQGKD